MQHQGHVQMVSRIFDYGQNPQKPATPRAGMSLSDLTVGLEEKGCRKVSLMG